MKSIIRFTKVRWLINTQLVLNQCSIKATHDVWIYDLYWGLLYVVPVVKTVVYTKWHRFCGTYDRDLHVLFEFGMYSLLICMSGSYSYYTRSKDIAYIFGCPLLYWCWNCLILYRLSVDSIWNVCWRLCNYQRKRCKKKVYLFHFICYGYIRYCRFNFLFLMVWGIGGK